VFRRRTRTQTSGESAAGAGWQRMALQILYFVPGNLQAPRASFDAVVGRLLVSPVLQVLVFGNSREEVRRRGSACRRPDPRT